MSRLAWIRTVLVLRSNTLPAILHLPLIVVSLQRFSLDNTVAIFYDALSEDAVIDWRILESIPFFQGCNENELRCLAQCFTRRHCTKFEQIHEEGSPSQAVYVVLQGEVAIQKKAASHHEPTHRNVVVVPGELFGFGEVMLKCHYTSAIAQTKCVLLKIAKEDFIRHFLAVPCLREGVLAALSEIVRILMYKVSSGGMNELALYLYQLGRESGKVANGKIHIQKKIRQPEIAAVLNLSREHVTRLFTTLRAEKAVQFNRGYPIIDKAWLDRAVQDKGLAGSIRYRTSPL